MFFHNSCRSFALSLLGGVAIVTLGGNALAAEPVLQTEQSDVVTLKPYTPHTILVMDSAGTHAKDGRVYVVDADRGALLGMVQAAYNPNVAMVPDASRFYVGETTWAHGNRGARYDLLAEYDARTLKLTSDEELPARALITPKRNSLTLNVGASYAYVYQMSPNNGVEVVDTHAHKMIQSVDLPGCALTYPWGTNGFSSLCADGTLANVSLGEDGKASMTHSAVFFAPDKDAVFENSPSVTKTGEAYFLSYTGNIYPAHLGANSTVEAPWSLQVGAGMKPASDASAPFETTWRPGGIQLIALHQSDHELYVLMHRGTFWTHKEDGTEVWVYDAQTHKRLRRIPLKKTSNMVGVTQDDHPLMFTTDTDGDLFVYDAQTGHLLRTIKKLGTSVTFTVAPGEE